MFSASNVAPAIRLLKLRPGLASFYTARLSISFKGQVMNVTHLYCSACDKQHAAKQLINLCDCGKPLMVAYDLERAARTMRKDQLAGREPTLWRYCEVLLVTDERNRLTLGEGFTPLVSAERLGASLRMPQLYIKDESLNPTQSFKARGMAVAVSMAKELGAKKLAAPAAGNA